jgi:hypothetical protein
MAFRFWFQRPAVDRETAKTAAAPLLTIIYLCGAQCGLMLAVTAVLARQKSLAGMLYDCCRSAFEWIPFLSRYGEQFVRTNREDEFRELFAIYASYFAIEVAFLLITFFILLRHVDFRTRNPFGSARSFALLAVALIIFLIFLYGDYNVARSRLASSGNLVSLLAFCAVLPSANFIIALALYAEYGRAMHDLTRAKYRPGADPRNVRRR